jgi:hypothetical protein
MHWTVKGFVHNQKEKAFVKEVLSKHPTPIP